MLSVQTNASGVTVIAKDDGDSRTFSPAALADLVGTYLADYREGTTPAKTLDYATDYPSLYTQPPEQFSDDERWLWFPLDRWTVYRWIETHDLFSIVYALNAPPADVDVVAITAEWYAQEWWQYAAATVEGWKAFDAALAAADLSDPAQALSVRKLFAGTCNSRVICQWTAQTAFMRYGVSRLEIGFDGDGNALFVPTSNPNISERQCRLCPIHDHCWKSGGVHFIYNSELAPALRNAATTTAQLRDIVSRAMVAAPACRALEEQLVAGTP